MLKVGVFPFCDSLVLMNWSLSVKSVWKELFCHCSHRKTPNATAKQQSCLYQFCAALLWERQTTRLCYPHYFYFSALC